MISDRHIFDLRGLVLHGYYRNPDDAAFEFLNIYVMPLLRKGIAPIQIIAVLEGSNERRRAVLPTYKVSKAKDEEDELERDKKDAALLQAQRILMHMGCTLVKTPHVEADDTIAMLVESLKGHKTVYTVDHDLMALWRKDVTLMVTDRTVGQALKKNDFKMFELDTGEWPPEIVTLYKSIVGDTSDNYIGVRGIGEKKFIDLLADIGQAGARDLIEIVSTQNWEWLEYAAEGHKTLTLINTNREDWFRSWYLAKLHPEWCHETWRSKIVQPIWAKRVPQVENLRREFDKAGINDVFDDYKHVCVETFLLDAKWPETNDFDRDVLAPMLASPAIAFDWESYDSLKHPAYQEARGGYVDVLSQVLTGGSFCYGPNFNKCFYLPVAHRDTYNLAASDLKLILNEVKDKLLIAQNAMFEMVVAKKNLDFDFKVDNLPHDTKIMASYVNENTDAGLKKLSKTFLNFDQLNYSEVVPSGGDMRDVSGDEVLKYGCDDSIVTAHLAVLFQIIMEVESTWDFYEQNERHFWLAHLEPFIRGIPIDLEKMAKFQAEDAQTFENTERELREILSERCATLPENAHRPLWEELKPYYEAQYRNKLKEGEQEDPEALRAILADKEEQLIEALPYAPYAPPSILKTKHVSAAARAIGLPAIRSLAEDRLDFWTQSIIEQSEEVGFTPIQERFVQALQLAKDTIKVELNAPVSPEAQDFRKVMDEAWTNSAEAWQGSELNVGSPKQMAELFYGTLGLPILIRNQSAEGSVRDAYSLEGSPATNDLAMKTWLVELEEDDWRRHVIELVSTMRACKQRESLYYRPYPLWVSPVDHRIHPQFNNCGTITRRPTGSSPNLLQVSKHKDQGRMRSTILPQSEDEVVVSIDFSQQELALLAAVSLDDNLLACYSGDHRKDVHTMTSTAIMNVYNKREGNPDWTYDDYNRIRKDHSHESFKRAKEVRDKQGKPTNFLLVYGGSPTGLARKLIVPVRLAEQFYDGFHKTYPGVAEFQEKAIKFARKHGYYPTVYGNRKHVPTILDKDGAKRSGAERQVVNMPMQGSAADILKSVLRVYCEERIAERTGCTLYACVYDEIVASVPKKNLHLYVNEMVRIMQVDIPGSPIQLVAEASFGPSWGEQIELEGDHSVENIKKCLNNEIFST